MRLYVFRRRHGGKDGKSVSPHALRRVRKLVVGTPTQPFGSCKKFVAVSCIRFLFLESQLILPYPFANPLSRLVCRKFEPWSELQSSTPFSALGTYTPCRPVCTVHTPALVKPPSSNMAHIALGSSAHARGSEALEFFFFDYKNLAGPFLTRNSLSKIQSPIIQYSTMWWWRERATQAGPHHPQPAILIDSQAIRDYNDFSRASVIRNSAFVCPSVLYFSSAAEISTGYSSSSLLGDPDAFFQRYWPVRDVWSVY